MILFEAPERYYSIFTMVFFYIGIFLLNINLKIYNYLTTQHYDSLTLINSPTFEEKEEEIMKLDTSYIKSKNEIKLETIFATDIDVGIIFFSKETQEFKIKKKIKLFILKFCYTPGFCLHACRLSAILWINLYMTYVSILLIIWLAFSLKYSMTKFFLIGTKYIIYPFLILLFMISYVSCIFFNDGIPDVDCICGLYDWDG